MLPDASREPRQACYFGTSHAGGSVSEVARRHALQTSLLFRWRRELSRRRPSAPASPAQGFVPVRLPPPSVPAPPAPARSGSIEVVLVGGRSAHSLLPCSRNASAWRDPSVDVDTGALLRNR